jgi:hypothetical protein
MVCHAGGVEIPRGDFAPHLLDNTLLMNVTVLGDICWAVAYILIIIQCFRQKTYGLPLAAIAMNITWEIQYSLIEPPRCDNGTVDVVKQAMILAWVVLDLFLVYQLYRYGRAEQHIAEIRRHFPLVVTGTILLAAVGHLAFSTYDQARALPVSGMIINFVMSILFVGMAYNRPHLRGLSWSGAWFRVAGNGLIFFANIFLMQEDPVHLRAFFLFLFGGTALFDITYLALLRQRRQQLHAAAAPA